LARIGHSCFEILNSNKELRSPYFHAMYCNVHGWIPFDQVEVRLNPRPLFLCPICHKQLRFGPRHTRVRRVWREKGLYKIRDKIIQALLARHKP